MKDNGWYENLVDDIMNADLVKHHSVEDIKLFENILRYVGLPGLIGHSSFTVLIMGHETLLIEPTDTHARLYLAINGYDEIEKGSSLLIPNYRNQSLLAGLL